jgi:hypothetical protein
LSESLIDINVSDVAVLEDNTEILKLLIQILDHLSCHLTLKIEDLTQPDAIDEYSDTFVYFGIEELIKAASA